MKKGKKYNEVLNLVDKNKKYAVAEAIELAKKTKRASFDETIELAINLNLDTKKVEQQLRGAFVMPHGIGKVKKVLVLAKGEQAKVAQEMGADYVGDIDLITKIEKENWFDFDVIIATLDMMPTLGKIGRLLGPKGLMPNPKTGTVTNNVASALSDIKKGRVEYRADSYGNVHVAIGKVSFANDKLIENLEAFMKMIIRSKPSVVKGIYLKNVSISTTMGPGIKIDPNSFDN